MPQLLHHQGIHEDRENKGVQDMSLGHPNIYNEGVEGILAKRERDKGGDGVWGD